MQEVKKVNERYDAGIELLGQPPIAFENAQRIAQLAPHHRRGAACPVA